MISKLKPKNMLQCQLYRAIHLGFVCLSLASKVCKLRLDGLTWRQSMKHFLSLITIQNLLVLSFGGTTMEKMKQTIQKQNIWEPVFVCMFKIWRLTWIKKHNHDGKNNNSSSFLSKDVWQMIMSINESQMWWIIFLRFCFTFRIFRREGVFSPLANLEELGALTGLAGDYSVITCWQ